MYLVSILPTFWLYLTETIVRFAVCVWVNIWLRLLKI